METVAKQRRLSRIEERHIANTKVRAYGDVNVEMYTKRKKLMAYVQIESLNLGTPKLGTQTNM